MGKISEVTYEDNLRKCAEELSQIIEESFQKAIKSGEMFFPLPPKGQKINEEAAATMLDLFIEYLLGTSVAVCCHYINTETEFEEHLIGLIREKFVRIRKMEEDGQFRAEPRV